MGIHIRLPYDFDSSNMASISSLLLACPNLVRMVAHVDSDGINPRLLEILFGDYRRISLRNGRLRCRSNFNMFALKARHVAIRSASKPSIPQRDASIITKEDLKKRIGAKDHPYTLIDVREPSEIEQTGRIDTAHNIPLGQIGEAFKLDEDTFSKKYGFSKPKQDQDLIFSCRSGVRSQNACDIAEANRYTNVINYKGSALEWFSK
eukprot:TRINITY_DN6033_c0_g1_i1.p1 TRINITY_DN6033_c0_g1~~TRINITY_DN6033_c0_g1_i1.p1  ORF type:complete len:206 (-),score=24.69 TRINITY_DN6033_c0_g1_i1:10-627(-)